MATLQQKSSHGHKYWYIVESRRVNGKPRPIVLAYLGNAEDLLARLQEKADSVKVKSYSHGAVVALLDVARKLDVATIINQHVKSPRKYTADKPLRNGLTGGMTLLLAAVGRVCRPTSKRGWWDWAKTTSCEYLLRCALSRLDSQHFWDMMDALPVEAIPKIEQELLTRVQKIYGLETDTLFFDATNFFTYIATTNDRCTVAQRGKNKQKRGDLRQVGLALVVSRRDYIPLFHLTYQGNRHDSKVFGEVIESIKGRMTALGLDIEKHTLVFDRGNNSKKNLAAVAELKIHYVGALTPCQHRALVDQAADDFAPVEMNGQSLDVYRRRHDIWGASRTVLLFVSDKLKAGQWRGVQASLEKQERQLKELQQSLDKLRKKPQDRRQLENRIAGIVAGQFVGGIIDWSLTDAPTGGLCLTFAIDQNKLAALEDELGIRMLMTDRHDWETTEIISAYQGQAAVEQAFKNIKNPFHLTLKPQHHWTDQKISVHFFTCVLGYLLSTLVWRQARERAGFAGTLDSLLDMLGNIRLATLIEHEKGRGKPKARYQLEVTSDEEARLLEALEIKDAHINRPCLNGVGVYNEP